MVKNHSVVVVNSPGSYGFIEDQVILASTGTGVVLSGYFIAHLQFSEHVV